MKNICIVMTLLSILSLNSFNISAKSADELRYEIKCAGSGQQGFYIVEVTAQVNNKRDIKMDFIKRCATHGVLFKGFSGEPGCKSQSALLSLSAESQNKEFFNSFFKHDYMIYASAVDGTIQTVKDRKKYLITATIQIAKEELRKRLEDAGILRKLGF